MSKLMVSSSVLRELIKTCSGEKEETELYNHIDSLKDAIIDIVKVQASLGLDARTQSLMRVNESLAVLVTRLESLLEEVEDQIVPLQERGGAE